MHVEAFEPLADGRNPEIPIFGGFGVKNRRSSVAPQKLYMQFKRCCTLQTTESGMLRVRAFPRKTRFSRFSPASYRFVVRFFARTPRFVEGRPSDSAARVVLRRACRSRHSIGHASLSGEGPHRVSSAFVPDFEKSVGHFSTGTLPSSEESVFRSALLAPGSKNPKNNKIVVARLFSFECPADARRRVPAADSSDNSDVARTTTPRIRKITPDRAV